MVSFNQQQERKMKTSKLEKMLLIVGIVIGFSTGIVAIIGLSTLKPNRELLSDNLLPVQPLLQLREKDGYMYTTDYLIRYTQTDVDCMTANIYFEANNQKILGQQLVAKSVMNRFNDGKYTQGKDNTLCNIITAGLKDKDGTPLKNKCQYSWYCDGKSDRVNLNKVVIHRAWGIATEVATRMLNGSMTYDSGLTHYHTYAVSPNWKDADNMHYITRVGAHLTYVEI